MLYVARYNQLRKLAKMGFTQPLSDLNSHDADILLMIYDEVERLEAKDREAQLKAAKGRGRR